jgi:phenylpropionate dioxygenase-like ring-hydroxylating dioxygenase large terminal subunit
MDAMPQGYRYPFTPFPRSWYFVARSAQVERGARTVVPLCGYRVVLTRSPLGMLGATAEEAGRPPRSCPVRERNGIVWVYHHERGEAPDFEIPVVSEYGSRGWSGYHTAAHEARVHVQETAENAIDMAHLHYLHKLLEMPRLERFDVQGTGFEVEFSAARRVLGRVVESHIHLTFSGLGLVVARVLAPPVRLILLVAYTPIDVEHTAIRLSYLVEKTGFWPLDRLITFFALRDANDDYERDIPIWEHKVYHDRPVLAATDGPFMKLRRWASQFYGEAGA